MGVHCKVNGCLTDLGMRVCRGVSECERTANEYVQCECCLVTRLVCQGKLGETDP